jgi:hypothetical protein
VSVYDELRYSLLNRSLESDEKEVSLDSLGEKTF